MSDAVLNELLPIIFGLIEPDYMGHIEVFEDLEVIFRGVPSPLLLVLVNWSHEGNELVGDDPIEIAIFYFLIVLVLFWVKGGELVPAKLDGILESFEALDYLKKKRFKNKFKSLQCIRMCNLHS